MDRLGLRLPIAARNNSIRIEQALGAMLTQGQIIYNHIGEGAYGETERQIQAALAAAKSDT